MRGKLSLKYRLILRMVALLAVGFSLVSVILWLFFRNDVRNIGHYIYYGTPEEAVRLIADYVGDPPSRLKSRILAQAFNLTIVYRIDDRIQWVVSRGTGGFPPPPPDAERPMGRMSMQEMHGRMDTMRGTMHGRSTWVAALSDGRSLQVALPMHLRRHYLNNPFYFFFGILALIALVITLSLRKTLSPLDRIAEAADRIGGGDLSHRISHGRNDEFGKVASAFNTMASRLSVMLSNQRDLLHFISHELRTPLARIGIALELKDSGRSREIIKSEIHEIDALIKEVSELSRLDTLDDRVNKKDLEMVSLLQGLIDETVSGRILYSPGEAEAWVRANDLLIKKTFSNLIDNALKYSDDASPVRVDLKRVNESYAVSIENAGGIPTDEIDRIWTPFFRGSESGRGGREGRGLGLVVVKKAVELSGGAVEMHTRPQGPTIFRVILPRKS
jgi:signal transduction histidine kinase